MPLAAELNSTEITADCQRTVWRPRLNLLDSASIRVPSQLLSVETGIDELHVYDADTDALLFSGPVWQPQGEGGPDSAYLEVTAFDHRVYLGKRLCKDTSASDPDNGNLITPGDVILDEVTAPEILAAYINNTISIDGALPLTLGTVDTGGADVTGVPTNFPMYIEQMRNLLTGTGQLDQVLTPGVGSSTLDLLNDYDNDLSGSVVYEYGTGAHNCQVATLTIDMEVLINALWYLLGPRLTEERWRGSITPTGAAGALLTRITDSRSDYGYFQEIRVFDDKGDENSIRLLFEEEWANEAWVRAVPRTFASIRPERGLKPEFAVGDQIGVAAGAILNGGFSGAETVYGFDWACDADGVDEIEEILTSADAQGA